MGALIATVERVLPAARTGSDLVPGVPQRVVALADQLDQMARGLALTERLLGDHRQPGWEGAAAAAFTHLLAVVAVPYGPAARTTAAAAEALRDHAGVLAAAQRDADDAIALDLRAVDLQRTAGAPSGIVPPTIAVAMQDHAVTMLQAARARVRASAAAAAGRLRASADCAPDRPNPLLRLINGLAELQRELQLGAVESSVSMVTALAAYTPNRLLVDPRGWDRDVRALGRALHESTDHPGQTLRALVDWQNAVTNPGRFIGHLAPDAALAVATGGAGLVAGHGASVGVRVAGAITPGVAGADVRAGMRAASATTRSRLRLRDLRRYEHADGTTALTPGQHLATAALARDAAWAERDLTERVQLVTRSAGLERAGAENVLKGRESLLRKVSDKVTADRSLVLALGTLGDGVRYTVIADGPGYVTGARAVLAGLQRQGMVLAGANNAWGSARYRGLNLVLADPRTGRLLEVQVHTPESHHATVLTHDDYERFRAAGTSPLEKAILGEGIAREYRNVPVPEGIEQLDVVLGSRGNGTNAAPTLLTPHPWAGPAALVPAGSSAVASLPCGDDVRCDERQR